MGGCLFETGEGVCPRHISATHGRFSLSQVAKEWFRLATEKKSGECAFCAHPPAGEDKRALLAASEPSLFPPLTGYLGVDLSVLLPYCFGPFQVLFGSLDPLDGLGDRLDEESRYSHLLSFSACLVSGACPRRDGERFVFDQGFHFGHEFERSGAIDRYAFGASLCIHFLSCSVGLFFL